jgi:hypothetical protein
LADRPPQGELYLRPHVWRKRGIGKESHLVSNADAVTQAKIIIVKVERRCHDKTRGSSLPHRPAQHILSPFARLGHRRTPNASRRLLQFSILVARAITHRTSPKAELFCEIRMRRQAAVMIASNAMDAYYCWLFPESLTQLEGAWRKRQTRPSPFF